MRLIVALFALALSACRIEEEAAPPVVSVRPAAIPRIAKPAPVDELPDEVDEIDEIDEIEDEPDEIVETDIGAPEVQILDSVDRCPDELDGPGHDEDDDGCPDPGD